MAGDRSERAPSAPADWSRYDYCALLTVPATLDSSETLTTPVWQAAGIVGSVWTSDMSRQIYVVLRSVRVRALRLLLSSS